MTIYSPKEIKASVAEIEKKEMMKDKPWEMQGLELKVNTVIMIVGIIFCARLGF
jgi:hypothetical protein